MIIFKKDTREYKVLRFNLGLTTLPRKLSSNALRWILMAEKTKTA